MTTPKHIRVLILEDNSSDAELMVDALRQAGLDPDWERVESEADFVDRLAPGLDLILSDYYLPQFNGIRALQLARGSGLDLPFIIVSGNIGEDIAVEAMRSGADDYLLKDRMARLGPAARQALERRRLMAEAGRAEAERRESEIRFRQIQETSRLKSEFLANMSHELRTPLNGIIGFSEFLVDEKPGKLNPKQKEFLNDILNSGRHLSQLINDVLDLSKVEAGKMELFPETFALSKAVGEVCSVISPMATTKRIAIRREISPALESVTLDQQKFKQVLYNLLSNAVKFTDDGGQVEIVAALHEPGQLRMEVRDTGIGIKPEDFKKLFVEFQQLDSGTARRYEGTGLGLALTKKLVEFQKGSITVASETGKGSAFTVIVPLGVGKETEPQAG